MRGNKTTGLPTTWACGDSGRERPWESSRRKAALLTSRLESQLCVQLSTALAGLRRKSQENGSAEGLEPGSQPLTAAKERGGFPGWHLLWFKIQPRLGHGGAWEAEVGRQCSVSSSLALPIKSCRLASATYIVRPCLWTDSQTNRQTNPKILHREGQLPSS